MTPIFSAFEKKNQNYSQDFFSFLRKKIRLMDGIQAYFSSLNATLSSFLRSHNFWNLFLSTKHQMKNKSQIFLSNFFCLFGAKKFILDKPQNKQKKKKNLKKFFWLMKIHKTRTFFSKIFQIRP